MTDLPNTSDEFGDAALIGEYALGLLPSSEMARIERRMAQEPELAALHRDWVEALSPLLDAPETAPPARLRGAIEGRLFPGTASMPTRHRWLGWLGLIGGPVAAFAVAFFLLNPASSFDPSLHVDLLAPEAGVIVAAGADEETLRIILQDGSARPGRAIELWLIAGEEAPVSLGLVPASGQIDIPRPPGLAPGVVFAISDEPEGGSPTGAPTGEILAAEPLFEI